MSTTRRTVGALSAVAIAAVTVTMTGGAAVAAPPQLPDNMVIFSNRDFVTVEGFEGLEGQQATVKVLRGGATVGQTTADITYPEAGVAFEVNHPGGACWGAAAPAGLNVTPDIVGGDTIEITVDGTRYDTPVLPVEVESMELDPADASKVVVMSAAGAGTDLSRMEGRIIEPALADTAVGRRDVRAVNGDTSRTPDVYTSTLEEVGGKIVATYDFADPDVAAVAVGGGARLMAWVSTAANGDRAGITIAELGEEGGPGMGGCPAGPGSATQPAPGSATFQRSTDKTQMQVRWTPADSVAGADPVSGYQVTVVDSDGNLLGRNTGPEATLVTIAGLDPAKTYTVQVRAAQGDTLSKAFTAGESTGTPDPSAPGDTEQPVVSSSFDADTNALTLTATDNSGKVQVYYTLDGTLANEQDMPATGAVLYTEPITLSEVVTVNFAAFDPSGNVATGSFTPDQVAPPAEPDPLAAPGNLAATSVVGGVRLTWDAVTGADDYEVTVDPAVDGLTTPLLTSGARAATVSGLTEDQEYTFTVIARAPGRTGTPSAPVVATPLPQPSDTLTATAELRTRDVEWRVNGTATAVTGNTVTVRQYNATTQQPGALIGTGAVAADGTWTVRSRGQSPLEAGTDRVIATSSAGGTVIAPFTTRR